MKKRKRQVRLLIASNTGGSCKTTTAIHLAYCVAAQGYKAILIELDSNGSLKTFTGSTQLDLGADNSMSTVLKKGFKGNYPLTPLWSDHMGSQKIYAIFGGKSLDETISEIELSGRKYLTLDDRLTDYPLDADLVIFDTPASLKPMALLGLVACTHVLAPIKPEHKDTGAFAGFLEWYYDYISEMRLNPKPELIGFLPCRVDLQVATHRDILGLDKKGKPRSDIPYEETLPGIVQALGIHCYPMIRESSHYLTASGYGLPIHLHRPGLDVSNDFNTITNHIIKLIKEGQ